MELSNSLLKKFARITNDASDKASSGTNMYATAVVIGEKSETKKYVRLDGSDILTPVSEAADIRDGDRVLITISNHTATVAGNITAPPSARTATDMIPVLEAQTARIDTLVAGQITTEYLTANYATIAQLQAQEAKIGNLEANRITTDYLEANYASIISLNATNAVIGSLQAGVADINTLMFGSASGNVIQTQFSNSVIAQLGDAQIKSAMIEEIAADKITGLDINTTRLTVHSDDGNSKWQDNTIQISDGTKLRVQIGKDANSDYNMYIWDKNGKLMFDALGLTGDGIQREIIRNDMVREDANISAGKLDIGSLFTVMNNDGTHTLRSNKIYVDADGQTLDISFKQMTTAVNGISDTQISQGTQLSVIQGQITNKIWEQDITDAVGGVSSDVTALSTKYSILEQNLNGFKAEVGNTYATASGLAAVDTKYTQLADRFEWVVKSGTSVSNFTITDRMAELTAAYINLNGLVTFSGLSPNIQTDISSAASSASNALNIANDLNKRADSGEFKGEKGDTGNGIRSSAVTYQASTSGTSVPTGTWSTSIPAVAANSYLWTRTVLTYTDGSTSTSYSVGKMGATGATGKGVKSVVEQYYLSTSNTSQAGGSWKNTQDAWTSGKYVWIRQAVTWTDNSTTYTTPVLASAINSANQNASTATTTANTANTNASSALSISRALGGVDLTGGKMLYTDPTFSSGANSTNLYKNSGAGTATWTRVAKASDNPVTGSNYEMRFTSTGVISPANGGFNFNTPGRVNAVYVYRIIAKVQMGRSIVFATNSLGTNGTYQWLTDTAGTGRYKEYVIKVMYGTGSVSTTGFFYFNGAVGTSSSPVTTYVAYATCYDITNIPDVVSANTVLANWCYNNDKTIINGGKIATGTIAAAQIASNAITAVKIAAGAITTDKLAANAVTAAKIATGAVTADKIAAKSITADKLSVTTLSSLTANIGTITGGKISGWNISANEIYSTQPGSTSGVLHLYSNGSIKVIYSNREVFNLSNLGEMKVDEININDGTNNKWLHLYGGGIDCSYNSTPQELDISASRIVSSNCSIDVADSSVAERGFRIKNGMVSNYVSFIISAAGNRGIYDTNGATWVLMNGTDNTIKMPRVYAKTVTSSANINVASDGSIRRYASSSQRYKHDICYYSNEENAVSSLQKRGVCSDDEGLLSILKLLVCSFLYNDGYITEEGYDPEQPIYGFIAEDVDRITPDATDYRMEGNGYIPESWDVKKLFPKVVYVAQKHESEIQKCKEAITLMYGILEQAGLLTVDIKDRARQIMTTH